MRTMYSILKEASLTKIEDARKKRVKGEVMAEKNMYEPKLRPAYYGGMPPGVKWEYVAAPWDLAGRRSDLPRAKNRYGVVKTERPLTKKEYEHFDLSPVSKIETSKVDD